MGGKRDAIVDLIQQLEREAREIGTPGIMSVNSNYGQNEKYLEKL